MKRIIGLLGWLGVVLVLAAVALRFVRPDLPQWYQRLALAGLIVTALYAVSQWRDIARSFQGRNVKYGSMAVTGVLLVLGILVAINWIASRQNKRWDLSSGQQFSLSDQTKKIVTELKKPVNIKVFYAGASDPYRDRLSEYEYLSKQVSVDYVDGDRDPVQTQKYTITQYPTLVLEYDNRSERATSADESAVTNALKKLIEGKPKKLYFVQGHGEHDPTVADTPGMNNFADALKTDNFETAKLVIAQEGKIPDDATVLVIAGPKSDLLAPELDLVRAYLKKGGKLLLMVDPPDKSLAPPPAGLTALAKEWGVQIGNDLIVDASGLGQLIRSGPLVPIGMPVQHAITNNFRQMTAFPLARSVTPIESATPMPTGPTASKVVESSPQSWAETDIKSLYDTGRPERNLDKGDKAGPIAIVVAASQPAPDAPAPATPDAPKPESRVVITGDSDFASNQAFGLPGNSELALNIANWLAQQEDLIAIRPKDPENRPITMTADQGSMVFWFSLVIVPALLFLNGVRVWWRKR